MIIKRVDESVTERFFKNDYHDRGMLKWGGFFLSDHTSAIQKMKRDKVPETIRAEQSLERVSQELKQAWLTKKVVHVQLKMLHKGETMASLTGRVAGFQEETIIFIDKEGRPQMVNVNEIRNVQLVAAPVDWHHVTKKSVSQD